MSGLSLCIQGTLPHSAQIRPIRRFIPVYTGNMWMGKKDILLLTVYPCVYREHVDAIRNFELDNGLSLCIQGTSVLVLLHLLQMRFIPVYTGNIQ